MFRTHIGLLASGRPIYKPIEVRGVCSDNEVKLYDCEQIEVEHINFDKILVGQKRIQTFQLVNNSSAPVSFTLGFQLFEEKKETGTSPRTFIVEKELSVLSCQPERGTLEPFSQTKLSIQCYIQPTPALLRYFNKYATRCLTSKDCYP